MKSSSHDYLIVGMIPKASGCWYLTYAHASCTGRLIGMYIRTFSNDASDACRRQATQAFTRRSEFLCNDVLNGFSRQQALSPQGWLVVVGADEDHCGQALDLQSR